MKRLLSLLLAILMIVLSVPFSALAEDDTDTATLASGGLALTPGKNFFTGANVANDFSASWMQSWWTGGQMQGYLVTNEQRTIANDGDSRGDYIRFSWDAANDGFVYGTHYPANDIAGYAIETDRPVFVGFYGRSSQDGYFLVGGNSESEIDYDFSRHCFFLAKDWTYYSSDFTIKDDASVLSNYWVRVGATVQNTAQTVDIDDVTIAPFYRFDYYVDGESYDYAYVAPVNGTNGAYLTSASASQIEDPVKDGYTFVGWTTTEGSTDAVDTVSLSNADVSFYAIFEKNATEPEPEPEPEETVGVGSPGINFFTTEENFVDFDDGDWQNSWWLSGQFQSYLLEGEERSIANDGDDRGDYLNVYWNAANNGILYAHYYPNGLDGIDLEDDRPVYVGFYAKSEGETYVKFGNFSGTDYDGGDVDYVWEKHCLYVSSASWGYYNTSFTKLASRDVFQQFRVSFGSSGDQTTERTLDIDDMIAAPYYRIDYLVDGAEYNHAYVSPISVLDGTFISSTEADHLGGLTPYKSGYKFLGWSLDGENIITTLDLENKDITLEAVFEETDEEIVPDAPTAPTGAKVGDPGINMYNANSIKYGFDKGTVGTVDKTVEFGTYGGAVSANVYLDGDNKVTYANIPSGGASHYASLQNYSFELARPITVCFDAKGSGTVNVLNYAADVQLLASQSLTSDWKTYSTEVSASEGVIIIHGFGADAYFDNMYIAANYKFNYYVGGSVYESVYISPLNDDGTLALTKAACQIDDPTKPGYTFVGWSLTDGGEIVDEITLGCKDVDLYAVWNFEGNLPGINVLTDDNTAFDFEDGNQGYVNFDGASQYVSDSILGTEGTGAWYVYMTRPQYNLTGYGRPVAISFKYKEEFENHDDFVKIIGNGVWEGAQTYSPTTEWQAAHYLADTTNAADLSDPAFIIYAVAGSGQLYFDDFVLAPAYCFTYFVDGEEYLAEYISPLDENGNYRESVVPCVEVPEKEGYKFVGWSASPAAGEALDEVALNNEDVVLYAVYELDENYYLGDGMATAFDSKIKGPYGTLIYRQNFDDADSIKDYEYDEDYVSDYAEDGASLSDTSFVYTEGGDGSSPLFTLVTDPVSGVGKSLSMTGKTDYPIYRLRFDGNVLSKPGYYRFNFKSNKGDNAVSERFRFYMNGVTNADTKTLEPSSTHWTEFPSHYGEWYTEEDGYKAAQQNFYPNNAFRVVTKEEFDNSGLANDEYTLDYVYSMNYFDVFLNMGNDKTLLLDDFEIWFEEYADVTFSLDGTDLSLDVTHRSFKPGSHLPMPEVPDGYKFLGWAETEDSDEYTMVAKAGKYTLYPVVKSISELDMENGLLGYEAVEDLDVSELSEINEVEYLPNVLEGDSFYDKAMVLAKAGVIDADFAPYEYITDTELDAINARLDGSEAKLVYTLKKNEDLMLLGKETEITADFITASDSYLATLTDEPDSTLDMGIWLWGNYNTRQYLRYDFTAKKEVEKAELEIHADNSFDIYVNGAYYPSYQENGWYVSKCVDITESVEMGVNKLGVRFFLTDSHIHLSNAMRASVKVTYTDGTSDTFKSSADGKWRFYVLCGHYECKEPENWMTVDSIAGLGSAVHLPLMYNENGLHPREIRRSMYYRTDFDSEKTVKSATLYAASKGLYIPYINGERVDNVKFISGAMLKVSEYQAFDVTNYIVNGTNTIAAQTGNGWYNSESVSNMYWNKPLVMMQLEIEYTDGTAQIVETDSNWKVTAAPLYDNDIMFGERYDARLEVEGWNEVGTDTSGWENAVKNTSSVPALKAQKYPSSKAHEQRAVSMSTLNDSSICYDFGTNSAGRAKLVLKNTKAGDVVIVRYAEDIHEGEACTEVYGDVYFTYDSLATGRAPYSAKNIDVYICKGAETEIFEPEFAYTGFRYIYVSGYNGEYTLDTVRKMDTYTDNEIVGSIETSNEDIMRLWDAVTRSYRSNTIGGPQDCPTREKNFWNGDIQVYVNTANWYMNNNEFLAAWTENGRKMEDGVYGWIDEEYIVPLSLYNYYENTDVLEAKYPVLLDLIKEREGHVASDGLPTGTQPYGFSPYNDHMSTVNVSADFYAAAFFCRMYRDAAEIASILGKTEDAEEFTQKFEEARATFNEKYYLPDEHDYNQRCQGGVVIPMAFGIAYESEMEGLAETLHNYVVEADYHQNSGFTSAEFLYNILCDYGYAEDAYKILTNETYPSLLYMLSTGATTMTERWDGIQPHTFASANHYAFGNFARFFFESLGGITIEKAGFDEISIKPTFIKELGDFKASHESRHGLIESGWVYNESSDTYKWTVSVPAGVSATLITPDGSEMFLTNATQTLTIGADGAVTGGLDIDIGERQSSSNVRYAEINGIQTKITENADNIFTVMPSSNMVVEIVEKTGKDTSEIVTSAYYYVNADEMTYIKLSLDSYMTTDGKKSIRLNDPMGIRYRSFVTTGSRVEEDEFVIDEYGFIIGSEETLAGEELTFDFHKIASGVAYNREDGTDVQFGGDDDQIEFTAVLKNLAVSKYKTNFVCKTYTKLSVNGEQFIIYGEPVVGNVYDTAKNLIENTTLDADTYNALVNIIFDYDNVAGIPGDDLFE